MQAKRLRRTAPLAPLLLSLVLLLGPSPAQAHDGAIVWRTVTTPHTEVHFPARLRVFAQRVATIAEEALTTLQPLFRYKPPHRVAFTIDDYVDSSNGFAASFPYDRIHIRAWPPGPGTDLADNGDWLRALVFHEVVHILHMGDVTGVSTLINGVFGRTWLPNQFLPRFWVEGLATYIESRYPGRDTAVKATPAARSRGGRVESARYMARLRGALRDGTWPTLAQLTGPPLVWPRGRGWYLYGSWLLDFQARVYGHAKLKRFISTYGGRLIPYGINLLYRRIYGRSALKMWAEATATLKNRVAQERRLRRRGLVPPRAAADLQVAVSTVGNSAGDGDGKRAVRLPPPAVAMTHDGEWRGRVRWLADGTHVVYARAPADGLTRIERLNMDTGARVVLRRCELDCDDVTPTPDGRYLLWIATRPVVRLYRRREIFIAALTPTMVDQAKHASHAKPLLRPLLRRPLRLGYGRRARNLSVSPSGRWLIWVDVTPAGLTEIRRLDLPATVTALRRGQRPPPSIRVVQAPGHDVILGTPTLDDQGTLYWTAGAGGERHIWTRRFGGSWHPIGPVRAMTGRGVAGVAEVRGFSPRPAVARWLHDLTWRRVHGRATLSAVVELGSFRDAVSLDLDQANAAWRLRTWTHTGVTSAALSSAGRVAVVTFGGRGFDVRAARVHAGRASATHAQNPLISPIPGLKALESLRYKPRPLHLTETDYAAFGGAYPRSWTPIVQLVGGVGGAAAPGAPLLDMGQSLLGFQLEAHDPLKITTWTLFAQTDLDLAAPMLIASLAWARYEPLWSFTLGWSRGTNWASDGTYGYGIPMQQWVSHIAGSWAYPYARGGWTASWSWRGSLRQATNERARWLLARIPEVPFGGLPYRPFFGRTSSVNLGLVYDRGERYPNSSVGERRRSIGFSAAFDDPAIGSELRQSSVTSLGRWTIKLGGHRALELRGKIAYALTYQANALPFALTGLPTTDLQTLFFAGAAGDFGIIRGLVGPEITSRLLAGRALAWGSAALHLPLPAIGAGLELLPLFLGRTWLSLFIDGARVWAGPERLLRYQVTRGGWAASVGAEFAVRLETAYIPQGSLRLGYAVAFGDVSSSLAYIRLGP